MSLSLPDNFNLRTRKQNFERDSFVTLEAMRTYPESSLPKIFIATCEETGKLYMYRIQNSSLTTLGKWREYTTGAAPEDVTDSWVIID